MSRVGRRGLTAVTVMTHSANPPPSATGGSAHSPGHFGRVANPPPSATGGSAHSPGRFGRVARPLARRLARPPARSPGWAS